MDAALKRLGDEGKLDGRGVTFTAELLERLLNATRRGDEGLPALSVALFERATFEGEANFVGATFEGPANFDQATFTGRALFNSVTFTSDARFSAATFTGDAWFSVATFTGAEFGGATFNGLARFSAAIFNGGAKFDGATFTDLAWFWGATFNGLAEFNSATFTSDAGFSEATFTSDGRFGDATFNGDAEFDRATFTGRARFNRATFTGRARFNRTIFTSDAWFREATFNGDAEFGAATVAGRAWFGRATFERAQQLGPLMVRKQLAFDRALFRERVQIEVSAATLSCRRASFLAGAHLLVRWAQVVLDGADLSAPSVLSATIPFPKLDDGDWPQASDGAWPVDSYGTPRLLSARGADVAGLTVAGVDLRACRFVDAHHLDQLRAEGSNFANTPPSLRRTKRRTITEEHQWRASRNGRGWYGPENQPPEAIDLGGDGEAPDCLELKELPGKKPGWLPPTEIAPLYRNLRKGLEDNRDEPGAADFYYGEMEMRRHGKRPRGFDISSSTEWAILTLYWLVSGYGLRAWRALASLTAVVLVASFIFAFRGFDRTGWGELPTALLFSTQATTALLRGPDPRDLTTVGEWLSIALRLIGPVLLGLAVLSVRGRVKR